MLENLETNLTLKLCSELIKFYPNVKRKINVIPLGPYSDIKDSNNSNFDNVKKKFNLPEKYIFSEHDVFIKKT